MPGINYVMLMMPGVNYVMYGYPSARTTPGVSLYRNVAMEENIIAAITQNSVIDDILKRQIKIRTLCACRSFLLT